MKLLNYVFKNIKNRRTRSVLCFLGIALSIINFSVITVSVNQYNIVLSNGFKPFKDYTQIIEKGSNYLQFVPVSSLFKDINSEIENDFSISGIPILYVSNEENELLMSFITFMGISQNSMVFFDILKDIGLYEGLWPQNFNEIVVGKHLNITAGEILEIREQVFNVCGVLNEAGNFFDRIILIDLQILQILFNREGKVSLILYKTDDIINITNFENSIEVSYSHLDCVTLQEIEIIEQEITGFSSTLAFLFSSLALITAESFFMTIIILNVNDRTKEFSILRAIGISNLNIFKLIISETLFLSFIGLIIGIPVSYISLSLIIIFVGISTGFIVPSFEIIPHIFNEVSKQLTPDFILMIIIIILLLAFLNTIIPTYLTLKKSVVDNLKIV